MADHDTSKGVLDIPAKVVASCLAMLGFASAVVLGLAVGNEPQVILLRATLIMIVAYIVGMIVGSICQRTIDLHIARFKNTNPIPDDDALGVVEDIPDNIPTRDAPRGASPM